MSMHATASYGDFLRALVRDPKGVSSPTPSSPALASAIAEQIDLSRPGYVLELGAGTGAVTKALLARGLAPARLIAIEQDPGFATILRQQFPVIKFHEGDALSFEKFLPEGAVISAVVSGIPLLNLAVETRRSLLSRAMACQDKGIFIQLSYSWKPPINPILGMSLDRKIVWRNFPPACVWTYKAEATS